MKKGKAKNQSSASTGFFSPKLSSELHPILMQEFDKDIENGVKLQEIGLRLVEFVAIKERSRETRKNLS